MRSEGKLKATLARAAALLATVTATGIGCLALFGTGPVTPAGGAAGTSAAGPDLTQLELGDGRVTTSGARRGYVYSCTGSFPPVPTDDRPWIDGSHWDQTAKPTVSGSVDWPTAGLKRKIKRSVLKLSGNGLPSHGTGVFPVSASDDAYAYDPNPNSISAYALTEKLSLKPKLAKHPTCLSGGTIGVIRTGAAFFDALDAGGDDAAAHEVQDSCGGHPQQQGVYHYHALPSCIGTGADNKHSKLIGWALDGFPIYGPRGAGGEYMRNSELDACHGHTHKIRYAGKVRPIYHYHATMEYPYTLGCFRGTL
ncbi:MAG: YHYH protein [Solirubrobacterales bacterium]|nr:YHYH protein [Solirubrobacterales bacterium]